MNSVQSNWGEYKFSPCKTYGPLSKYCKKLSQLLSIVAMKKQSTCFIFIIYPEKHNDTIPYF